MPTNQIRKPGWQFSVVVSDPTTPNSGDPVRYGALTGVALTDEGAGGNATTETTVDFGPGVWSMPVKDDVGGGVAAGDTLFYKDALDGLSNDPSGTYFFGFALAAVGTGATTTINVLHVPSPGSGTLGAGTIATANLANGILSANGTGRGKIAGDFFDAATVLDKFATDSFDAAELLKLVKDGAFAADVATRALFADGIWTQAKLDPSSLDGTVAKVVANGNVIGGIPVVFRIDVPDAATGDVDVISTHKIRVINVWAVKTVDAGNAANTVQVKNGANAITDALSININDQTIARAGLINDAQHEIAAGGTLRVTRTKAGGNAACTVYVSALRVA